MPTSCHPGWKGPVPTWENRSEPVRSSLRISGPYERVTGVEPATLCLAIRLKTTDPRGEHRNSKGFSRMECYGLRPIERLNRHQTGTGNAPAPQAARRRSRGDAASDRPSFGRSARATVRSAPPWLPEQTPRTLPLERSLANACTARVSRHSSPAFRSRRLVTACGPRFAASAPGRGPHRPGTLSSTASRLGAGPDRNTRGEKSPVAR